jgi:Zn-finger nucleic acid-binding protein
MQTPSGAYFFNGFHITYETDGWAPECKGIWDDNGRLVVVINHNTDLKSAYMWSDDRRYPERFSDYAYKLCANFIIYALSH